MSRAGRWARWGVVAWGLLACTRPASDLIVGRAGSRTLTARDVALRDAVVREENPAETRALGFLQLCRAYELAEVLGRNGRPVTDDILIAEAKRIDAATRDRSTLERIRALFRGDEAAYRRVFVLPTYVGRVGPFEFFPNDPAVQATSRLRAETFLAKMRTDPTSFRQRRKEYDALREFEVSATDGWRWLPETPQSASASAIVKCDRTLGDRWRKEILPHVNPGAVVPHVIDLGHRWLVARYRGVRRSVHAFDAALFDKGDFHRWLEAELVAHPEIRCVASAPAHSR